MGATIRMRTGTAQPAQYRTGLVAALDIGSSKITCLIGRAEPGNLRVLGAALRESQGIKAATVTSLDHAEESIREAVAAAENHADTRIQNVLISVACGAPTSVTARAAASLDGALVSDGHLHALLSEGRARCRLDGHEVIQAAPTSYVVDEARGEVVDAVVRIGSNLLSFTRLAAKSSVWSISSSETPARRLNSMARWKMVS